jgi:hypothetical protein
MSIGLRRARRRYWWPNAKGWAFTGLCIGLVYYYSLEAVAQDNYVRIVVPLALEVLVGRVWRADWTFLSFFIFPARVAPPRLFYRITSIPSKISTPLTSIHLPHSFIDLASSNNPLFSRAIPLLCLDVFPHPLLLHSLLPPPPAQQDDLAPLIPPASVLDRIETIEEANAARRARRAIPAQLLTVEPRPAHLQPFTPNSMPTSFGRFGLGPRMSYYWPKDGTLVPGAPSLIDDDLGEVGERFGSGWMGGGRV